MDSTKIRGGKFGRRTMIVNQKAKAYKYSVQAMEKDLIKDPFSAINRFCINYGLSHETRYSRTVYYHKWLLGKRIKVKKQVYKVKVYSLINREFRANNLDDVCMLVAKYLHKIFYKMIINQKLFVKFESNFSKKY